MRGEGDSVRWGVIRPLGGATDQVVVEWPSTSGNEHQPASGLFDLLPADDLVGAVIAPLDEDVGPNVGDQLERRVVVEDRDRVDGLERAQDLGRGPRPG